MVSQGTRILLLALWFGSSLGAQECPPPLAAKRSGATLEIRQHSDFPISKVAERLGFRLPQVFRAVRRGFRLVEVPCGPTGEDRVELMVYRLPLMDAFEDPTPKAPGISSASFFQRMPMDDWGTPEDGQWGVSRSGGRRRHKGIDMHAPEGTPIYTVAPGVVYRAWKSKGKEKDGGYGNYVILAHDARDATGLPYWTYYTHMLNPPTVQEGDRIPGNFLIGHVGRTPIGRFTNAHLHFEVRLGDGSELGRAVNATPFGPFHIKFHRGEGAF